jgi:hypothetical protein
MEILSERGRGVDQMVWEMVVVEVVDGAGKC